MKLKTAIALYTAFVAQLVAQSCLASTLSDSQVSKYTGLKHSDMECGKCDEQLYRSHLFTPEEILRKHATTDGEAAYLVSCSMQNSTAEEHSFLRRAVELGFTRANAEYAKILINNGNVRDAFDVLMPAIDAGSTSSAITMAEYYLGRASSDADIEYAIDLLQSEADKGASCANISLIQEKIRSTSDYSRISDEVIGVYRQEAVRGSVEAKVLLANTYLLGIGVPANRNQAIALFRDAASAGSRDAIYALAHELYMSSREAEAEELVQRPHLNRADAKELYAFILITTPHLRKDDEYVVRVATDAHRDGYPMALAALAVSYTLGINGWPKNAEMGGQLARVGFRQAKNSDNRTRPVFNKMFAFSLQQALRKKLIPEKYENELEDLYEKWGRGIALFSYNESFRIGGRKYTFPIYAWDSPSKESPARTSAEYYSALNHAKPDENALADHDWLRKYCAENGLSYVKALRLLQSYGFNGASSGGNSFLSIDSSTLRNAKSLTAKQEADFHIACARRYLMREESEDTIASDNPLFIFGGADASDTSVKPYSQHIRIATRLLDIEKFDGDVVLKLLEHVDSTTEETVDTRACESALKDNEIMSIK